MFSGMNSYTLLHVVISLVAILSGLVVLYGLLTAQRLPWWTQVFVWTTVATTLTGFGFPFNGFTPAIGTGIVSTLVLIFLLLALYGKKLAGPWRKVYVITAVISLYLNVFVLIVQSFLKVPALHALAPQGNEPPFAISQGVTLLLFIAAGFFAVRRFHPRA
jgi:hypothetical protein